MIGKYEELRLLVYLTMDDAMLVYQGGCGVYQRKLEVADDNC